METRVSCKISQFHYFGGERGLARAGWLKNETLIWWCNMTCELLIATMRTSFIMLQLHSCPSSQHLSLNKTDHPCFCELFAQITGLISGGRRWDPQRKPYISGQLLTVFVYFYRHQTRVNCNITISPVTTTNDADPGKYLTTQKYLIFFIICITPRAESKGWSYD